MVAVQVTGGGEIPTTSLQFRKEEWVVKDVEMATGYDLIQRYHYAKGASNTRTFLHGLFHRDNPENCLGVAWWLPPTKKAAINTYPNGDWMKVIALSRLVCAPEVPKNGESFLISMSIRLIRKDGRFKCLVTYADDYQGHTGVIYRATNWEYLGKTKATRTWVDNTGKLVAIKAGPKTKTVAQMQERGYKCIGTFSKHKYRIILN